MNSFNDYLAHGNAWLFIPAAIVLGMLHGLEPGHSKTMMAAFIVSIRGTVRQAMLLGVSATISHTAIIWILAFIGLRYAGKFNVETSEPYFQLATGSIVIGLAVWMFARTRREQGPATSQEHGHHHHHDHSELFVVDTGHGKLELSVFEEGVPPVFRLRAPAGHTLPHPGNVTLETIRPDGARQTFSFVQKGTFLESLYDIPEPHEFDAVLTLGHGDHGHTCRVEFREDAHHHHSHAADGEEFEDAHQREHAEDFKKRFANRQVTTGQLILFGLTGGLLPCPSAFAVLLICLQLKKFTLGFAIVLAFSLGLAITLVTVGSLAALSVKHASKRFKGFGELARKMPYVSSTVMILIGLLLAFQGIKNLWH